MNPSGDRTCPIAGQQRLGLTVRQVFPLGAGGNAPWLVVSQGSVVDFEGDAIVNAANEDCTGGGGVDGAVTRAGGPKMAQERADLPMERYGVRCPVGEARMTTGGSLIAKKCIHAVGPVYGFEPSTFDASNALLRSAYQNSLRLAKEAGLRTVAFSLLSSGVFRGRQSLEAVLNIAVVACKEAAYPGLQEVHLAAFTREELMTLISMAQKTQPPAAPPGPAHRFRLKDFVEAHGLKTEALNGQRGEVVAEQAGASGDRVCIRFNNAELGEKALKPENLAKVEEHVVQEEAEADGDIGDPLAMLGGMGAEELYQTNLMPAAEAPVDAKSTDDAT